MSQISPSPATQPAPSSLKGGPLGRVAMPLLVFAATLVFLLLLSWLFVLPRFTRFAVDGKMLGATALTAYGRQLQSEIAGLEKRRDALVVPGHDDAYERLRRERAARMDPQAIRAAVLSVAADVAGSDAVTLAAVTYDLAMSSLHLEGEVHGVGPRSMTVLAQFIDALSQASFVQSLTPPTYVRSQRKEEFYSPFAFDLVMQPSLVAAPHE